MDPVRETVFEWFKEAVVEVWGKWPEKLSLNLSPEEPRGGVLAALAYPPAAKPRVMSRRLIAYPRAATLLLADKLLVQPPEKIRAILLHEALHLGYPTHDRAFRDHARAIGAPVSGEGVDSGNTIKVQKKVGARFQTVREFPGDEESEALTWGKEQAKAEPGSRWRMLQGYDAAVPLYEQIEDAMDSQDPADLQPFLWAAYEIDPNLDASDLTAVKAALLAYAENERINAGE